MSVRIYPVIMSGGSGTRLWPLSTEAVPKQFHALGGAKSMIAETALRLSGARDGLEFMPPVIIAGEKHRDLVATRLAEVGVQPAAVVLEPEGRNTAATAAIAALVVGQMDPEALVLLMPADHVVTDAPAFEAAVRRSAEAAFTRIVTFGITPDRPETGYGYIKQGDRLSDGVFTIESFTEKPEREIAEEYLKHGSYSWNSGVFFFHPDVMLEEFSIAATDIREGARQALERGQTHGGEILLDAYAFAAVRAAPVDKAVMEKTQRAAVTPCNIGWADIGSWAELWRLAPKDEAGNSVAGPALTLDASNNLVRAEGVHVSIAGVSDLIVVATKDAVLILPRDRAQDVKKLIPGKGD